MSEGLKIVEVKISKKTLLMMTSTHSASARDEQFLEREFQLRLKQRNKKK